MVSAEIVPDSAGALSFLRRWEPEGPWVLTAVDPERRLKLVGQTFSAQQEKEALAFVEHWNGKRNLYFSVNRPKHEIESGKAKKEDIGWLVALHVDVDPEKVEGLGADEAALHYQAENARIKAKLDAYSPPPSVVIFSGGGYQAFWLLATPVELESADDIKRLEAYNRRFEKDLGGDHCFNVDRIMRLPGTVNIPDAKKRAAGRVPVLATLLSFDDKLLYALDSFTPWVEEKKQKASTAPKAKKIKDDWIERVLLNGPDHEGERHYGGDRSKALWAVCCALIRRNWTVEQIAEVILDKTNKLSEHVYHQNEPAKYAMRQAQRAHEKAGGDFMFNAKGVPLGNQVNIRTALAKLDVALSYDEFARRPLIEGPDGLPRRHLEDREFHNVYLTIAREFDFKPAVDFFRIVIEDECYANTFHPVRQYLDGLRWDGTKRVDTWLRDYGGAADNEFTRAVAALTLIAAVRRIRQPGVKFDEIVVLESPQGFNKSSALRALATRADWFTDSFPINGEDKQVIEALAGKWIVESPELKGMRRSDVEHHKAVLSRQIDRSRLSYARFSSEVPRQCVFFGTTNADSYLRDTTGNRRFWPIRVDVMDVALLARDVGQLWAEAAAREAAGESIRLDPKLYPFAAEEQNKRAVDDPWDALFEKELGDMAGKILSADIWTVVSIPVGLRTQDHNARLGESMKKLGWDRKKLRIDGKTSWCYAKGGALEQSHRITIKRDEYGKLEVKSMGEEGGELPDDEPEAGHERIPF